METDENVIEFLTGQQTATLSLTNIKYINKIKKLYEKHKNDFTYFAENKDGSICCKIPLKWVKISANKVSLSDEQKQSCSERLKKLSGDK